MIFQDLDLKPTQVAHIIKSVGNGNWDSSKVKPVRALKGIEIDYDQALGYFHGSCHGDPRCAGLELCCIRVRTPPPGRTPKAHFRRKR